jgi:hypothetical protein
MRSISKKFLIVVFLSIVLASAWPYGCLAAEDESQNYKNSANIDLSWSNTDLSSVQNLIKEIISAPFTFIGFNKFSVGFQDSEKKQYYSPGETDYFINYTKTDFTFSYLRTPGAHVNSILQSPYASDLNHVDTQGFFFLLGSDTIFLPVIKFYMDIDRDRQWSASLNISHTFELNKNIRLKSEVSANYLPGGDLRNFTDYDNINYFSPRGRYESYHDGILSLSLPITITPTMSFIPIVSYAFSYSDDAKREFRGRSLAGIANPLDPGGVFAFCGIAFAFAF